MKISGFITPSLAGLGFFWIALALTGEGSVLLVGPGAVSVLVAFLAIKRWTARFVKGLVGAASLYNLFILVYQAYASAVLLQRGFALFGALSLLGYGFASLLLAFITLYVYASSREASASRSS